MSVVIYENCWLDSLLKNLFSISDHHSHEKIERHSFVKQQSVQIINVPNNVFFSSKQIN